MILVIDFKVYNSPIGGNWKCKKGKVTLGQALIGFATKKKCFSIEFMGSQTFRPSELENKQMVSECVNSILR